MSTRDVVAATAKVVTATVFGGAVAGAQEGVSQVTDLVVRARVWSRNVLRLSASGWRPTARRGLGQASERRPPDQ